MLAIQIVTKNFPKPGDAHKSIDDPKYPSGRVIIQLLETERRKEDIDLIEANHPLLPIALRCLHNRDTERLSADEVCERLATLKREGKYAHSVERTKDQASLVLQRQQELVRNGLLIQIERDSHQREKVDLENQLAQKDRLLQRERTSGQNERDNRQREKVDLQNQLAQKDRLLQTERSNFQRERANFQDVLQRERADHAKKMKGSEETIEQVLEYCRQRLKEKGTIKEATAGRVPVRVERLNKVRI